MASARCRRQPTISNPSFEEDRVQMLLSLWVLLLLILCLYYMYIRTSQWRLYEFLKPSRQNPRDGALKKHLVKSLYTLVIGVSSNLWSGAYEDYCICGPTFGHLFWFPLFMKTASTTYPLISRHDRPGIPSAGQPFWEALHVVWKSAANPRPSHRR